MRDREKQEEWDTAPDPTVFKLNCRELLSEDMVLAALEGLFLEASLDIKADAKLYGGETALSRYWTIAVAGEPGLAARRVSKILRLLRLPDRTWRPVMAKTAAGQQAQVFLGPDKSRKQQATEMAAKKLRKPSSDSSLGKLTKPSAKASCTLSNRRGSSWSITSLRYGFLCIGMALSTCIGTRLSLPPIESTNLQSQQSSKGAARSSSQISSGSFSWKARATHPPGLPGEPSSVSTFGGQSISTSTLGLATWNAQALLHARGDIRNRKLLHLDKLAKEHTITCIHELHGDEVTLRQLHRRYEKTHFVGISEPIEGAGGILTLVRRNHFHRDTMFTHSTRIRGRLSVTSVISSDFRMKIYNAHHHDWKAEDTDGACKTLLEDINEAHLDPLGKLVCVLGDFNFSYPDAPGLRLPEYKVDAAIGKTSYFRSGKLRHALKLY